MLDIRAILGGLALDVALGLGMGLLLGLLTVMDVARRQGGEALLEEDGEQRLLAEMLTPATLLGLLAFSVVARVLAGFLTAMWADSAPLLNAAVMGALAWALMWLMERAGLLIQGLPRWAYVALHLYGVPAALLGGWLYVLSVSAG